MANVIIKSDERRHQEAAILSQFGGGCETVSTPKKSTRA